MDARIRESLPIRRGKMDSESVKSFCRDWLNANLHDGQDRYDAKADKHYMTPKDIEDTVFEMIDDLFDAKSTRWTYLDFKKLDKYSTIVHKEECEFWNPARSLPNCTCGLRELLKG
jgi:hypothetical protein